MTKATFRLTTVASLSIGCLLFVINGCRPSDPPSAPSAASTDGTASPATTRPPGNAEPVYRGLLGGDSWKIRIEDGKTYLWAGGDRSGPGSQWYDFTGSLLPAAELQYGIGKDKIPSIDDPLFVAPDDPRLLAYLPESPYRPKERLRTNDEIPVIGYIVGDDVRAYPVALLDRHELVNDLIGGKPVTVGW